MKLRVLDLCLSLALGVEIPDMCASISLISKHFAQP